MAQPARPRPRPRPVARQPSSAVADEDDLFRKNRGRTAQHWRQLEQSAAKAVPFTNLDDDWDLEDPGDSSFQKHRKKKPIKQNDRPRWQDTDRAALLSSDNEGDDVQFVEQALSTLVGSSPKKRKRGRSRSKSITPPPELPAHLHAHAMSLVRQALAVQQRPPSPTFLPDDSSDSLELDPELAQIAEAARRQAKLAHNDTERMGGPESVNVVVHWRPHPRNIAAQEQRWSFTMRRHDTFRELFDEVADLAGIMPDQLVINHDQRRVFASGTPHSLHIWAEGDLEACDKHTAEYIRAQRNNRVTSSSLQDDSLPPTIPYSDDELETDSAGGDTLKLVLRSAATKDKMFPLTVRTTTTCGAIVIAFLKAAGLPDIYSGMKSPLPHIVVDGDKMNSEAEIGDADLEDGDLVEISGV